MDLDGVLADFNGRRDEVLGRKAEGINTLEPTTAELAQLKEKLYRYLEEHPHSFFINLQPLPEAQKLWRQLQSLEPIILTAVPSTFEVDSSNYQRAAGAKQEWCRRHLGLENPERFQATTSTQKHEALQEAAGIPVLIDDRRENCQQWQKHGGRALHHVDVEQTIGKLNDSLVSLKRKNPPRKQ